MHQRRPESDLLSRTAIRSCAKGSELCKLTGFGSHKLPEVLPTVSAAPGLRKDVARDLGLPEVETQLEHWHIVTEERDVGLANQHPNIVIGSVNG